MVLARLKFAFGALVLFSLCLPMSRCAESESGSPSDTTTYVWEFVELRDPSTWVAPLLLIWPACLSGLQLHRRRGPGLLLGAAEAVGSLYSGFVISVGSIFREALVGTYVAFYGLLVYGLISAIQALNRLYSAWRARNARRGLAA